jgi:hypothetical protein
VVLPTGGYDASGNAVTLTWKPRYENDIYATILCQSSSDFTTWTDVPAALITTAADGTKTARVPVTDDTRQFLRLKFTAAP